MKFSKFQARSSPARRIPAAGCAPPEVRVLSAPGLTPSALPLPSGTRPAAVSAPQRLRRHLRCHPHPALASLDVRRCGCFCHSLCHRPPLTWRPRPGRGVVVPPPSVRASGPGPGPQPPGAVGAQATVTVRYLDPAPNQQVPRSGSSSRSRVCVAAFWRPPRRGTFLTALWPLSFRERPARPVLRYRQRPDCGLAPSGLAAVVPTPRGISFCLQWAEMSLLHLR